MWIILVRPKLVCLKLFFDNWKGRLPMLLQLNHKLNVDDLFFERYKEEGISDLYVKILNGTTN